MASQWSVGMLYACAMVVRLAQDTKKGKRTEAIYRCDHAAPEKPPECRYAKFLLFKFEYLATKRLSPYGEITYNYAEMCLDDASVREGWYIQGKFQANSLGACYLPRRLVEIS